MLKKILISFICTTMIFAFSLERSYASTAYVNPPRHELERKVEEVARKRGIPSVILKSIARVESVYKQFNPDGSVFTGVSGSIGLMQIYNKYGWFDDEKLKYDIDYNIEAGADVLLRKWDLALEKLPQIGNMDPNILENWYFAIWAYNGWSESNNPNTGLKDRTFQELVYYIAEKEYEQVITPIDSSLLPASGLPSKNDKFETPENFHYGDILTYSEGDIVKLDGKKVTNLKNEPNGANVVEINDLMELQIMEGPVLNKGYYWYKVKVDEINSEGWLVGNWITKIGTVYPFTDISDNWSMDYILKLHEMSIVNGSGDKFYPNDQITRQEMSVMLSRALHLEPIDTTNVDIEISDLESIESWAVEHVMAVTKADLMPIDEDTMTFNPEEYITREEAAIIISNSVGYIDSIDFELDYIDKEEISDEALMAVKNVQAQGIMVGSNNEFRPKDYLTRGEACKLIYDMLNFID